MAHNKEIETNRNRLIIVAGAFFGSLLFTIGFSVAATVQLMGQPMVPVATTSLTQVSAAAVPGVDTTLVSPIDPLQMPTIHALIAFAALTGLIAVCVGVQGYKLSALKRSESINGTESLISTAPSDWGLH